MDSSTTSRRFVKSSAVLKVIEFLARILLLLLLTDSVIGHVSDGTTAKIADSFMPPPPPSPVSSALSQSTNTTGSTIYFPTDKNGMTWISSNGRMAVVNSDSRSPSSNLIKNSANITKFQNKSASSNSVITGFRFYDKMQADSPIESGQPKESSDSQLKATQNYELSPNPSISSSSSSSSPSSENLLTNNATNLFTPQKQQEPPRKNYPYIDMAASPNVTALLGKTAYLSCRVKNLGDKTVSWVRHRDIHLITVGRYTYTTDQRFRAILQPSTDEYTLMIKYPQHRDSGIYECQVSTTPHLSHYVHLSVVEPVTEVVGGPDLFIDRGSTINLTCTVKFSPEPPLYIIWNHNNNIISYNSLRGGVSVLTEKGETTTSYLLIQQAKPTDSGRYSCNPSNAAAHSINVHVLNGELPDALQTGGQMPQKIPLKLCLLFSVVLIFGMA